MKIHPPARLRSWTERRATSRLLAAALAVVAAGSAGALHAQAAHADDANLNYGEVARIGGFDSGAFANTTPTSPGTGTLTPGKLVLPVGFAVDTNDPSMPDSYGIYVLDITNPQLLNPQFNAGGGGNLAYRLQKLDDTGRAVATTTWSVPIGGGTVQGLAVDSANHRVYTAVVKGSVQEVVAFSTLPTGSGDSATLPIPDGMSASPTIDDGGELAGPSVLAAIPDLFHTGGQPIQGVGNFAGIAVVQGPNGTDVALEGNSPNSPENTAIVRVEATGSNAGTLDPSFDTTTAGIDNVGGGEAGWDGLSSTPDGDLVAVSHAFSLAPPGPYLSPESTTTIFDSSMRPTIYAPTARDFATRAAGLGYNADFAPVIPDAHIGQYGLGNPVAPLDNGDFAGDHSLPNGSREDATDQFHTASGTDSDFVPSSLGLQISDAQGNPLADVGNVDGGACSIQGGGQIYDEMALAPGRGGAVFVLTQSDITDSGQLGDHTDFDPSDPNSGDTGDQIVEFAPNQGTPCPQVSGSFTITEGDSTPSPDRDDDLRVSANDPITFDASTVDTNGAVPYELDWDFDDNGTVDETDTWQGNASNANPWPLPAPTTGTAFTTAGPDTIDLRVHTQYGVYDVKHTVTVTSVGAATANLVATTADPKAGQAVTFSAAGSTPGNAGSIDDYEFDFGDGSEVLDTDSPTVTHVYDSADDYNVRLTIFAGASHPSTTIRVHVDAADQTGTTTQQTPPPPPPVTTSQTPPPPATTSSTPPPPPPAAPAAKLASPSAKVSAGKIAVGFKPSAAGTVTIKLTAKVGKRTVVIGTGHATVKAGKLVALKVTPTKAGKAALKKKTKVTVSITLKPKSGKSVTVTKSASLKLTAAKPKHKK